MTTPAPCTYGHFDQRPSEAVISNDIWAYAVCVDCIIPLLRQHPHETLRVTSPGTMEEVYNTVALRPRG